MVSRFLRLRFIGKRRKSVGFPMTDAMLWSPFNQISTRDSALVLKLEVTQFKSHWCSQVCFRTQPRYIATHILLITLHIIVCIGVSTRPKKTPPALSCQAPPLESAYCPSPLFQAIPPYILVFRELPLLKVGFFSEPHLIF